MTYNGNPAERTALYRIYAEDGMLLYIGISRDFGTRWKQHAKTQPWWGEMRRLTVDWCDSRSEAEAAEIAAIEAEGPKYNVTYAAPRPAGAPSRAVELSSFAIPLSELLDLPVSFGLQTAAHALGLGKSQAYEAARTGRFPVPVRKYGQEYRVTRPDLFRALGLDPGLIRAPEHVSEAS